MPYSTSGAASSMTSNRLRPKNVEGADVFVTAAAAPSAASCTSAATALLAHSMAADTCTELCLIARNGPGSHIERGFSMKISLDGI